MQIINSYVKRGVELRMEHLEAMAAAYLLDTDIPPDEVMLVEEHAGMTPDGGMRINFYYCRRSEFDDTTLHNAPSL